MHKEGWEPLTQMMSKILFYINHPWCWVRWPNKRKWRLPTFCPGFLNTNNCLLDKLPGSKLLMDLHWFLSKLFFFCLVILPLFLKGINLFTKLHWTDVQFSTQLRFTEIIIDSNINCSFRECCMSTFNKIFLCLSQFFLKPGFFFFFWLISFYFLSRFIEI